MSEKQKAFEKWSKRSELSYASASSQIMERLAWNAGWSAHARISVPLSRVLKILDGLGSSGMARIDARAWAEHLRKANRTAKRK